MPMEPEVLAVGSNGFGNAGPASTTDLLTLPTLAEVRGRSTLIRSKNGVRFKIKTTGLTPGNAYTLWMIVFNNPAECTARGPGLCDGADLFNPAAEPDMMWGDGKIAGNQETVVFNGHKRVGSNYGTVQAPVGLPSTGLLNPQGAEIWLAVHDHGPMNPEFMPDMIRSIDGGCFDAGTPVAGVDTPWNQGPESPQLPGYGQRGPNTCASVQIGFHVP